MKLHYRGAEWAGGVVSRCGIRLANASDTTTARARVTCQRCRNFLESDRAKREEAAIRKHDRRSRSRIRRG